MQFNEALDGSEQAIAQAALVRAAGAGWNQVDIALTHRLAVFGESHAPASALAFRKALVAAVGKTFALKQGDDRLSIQGLLQIILRLSSSLNQHYLQQ